MHGNTVENFSCRNNKFYCEEIRYYPHRVNYAVNKQPSDKFMKRLRETGNFDINESKVGNHWNLTAYNPSPLATMMIKDIGGWINAVELARDIRFIHNYEVFDHIIFHNKYFVQPNHRSKITVEYVNQTNQTKQAYNARRKARRGITWYAKQQERIDKQTGEITNDWWFHMEVRLLWKESLERWRIDINTIHDFDHQHFWSQQLDYRDVNFEQIGIRNANRQGKRIRKPRAEEIGGIRYPIERRNGYATYVALSVNDVETNGFSYEDGENEDPDYNKKYKRLSVQNAVDFYGLNAKMFPKITVKWVVRKDQTKTCEKSLQNKGREDYNHATVHVEI